MNKWGSLCTSNQHLDVLYVNYVNLISHIVQCKCKETKHFDVASLTQELKKKKKSIIWLEYMEWLKNMQAN